MTKNVFIKCSDNIVPTATLIAFKRCFIYPVNKMLLFVQNLFLLVLQLLLIEFNKDFKYYTATVSLCQCSQTVIDTITKAKTTREISIILFLDFY